METAEQIYDGVEPEIQVVEEVTEEAPTGETEPEVKAEAETTEEVTESSPDSLEETQIPISAMHGERDRRQAAEKENAELRAQLESAAKTDPTSVFEDEGKFRAEISETFTSAMTNQSLNQSEFFAARELGRDVLDQKIEAFKKLAENNPELRSRFGNSISPYHELVDIVNQHEELDKMKDMDGYKAKLVAEAKATARAEIEAELKAKEQLRESIPESLVGDASAGGLTSKGSFEPPPADELYN